MTWGRLDDKAHSHPKHLKAGIAESLWSKSVSWSNDQLTDGHLPVEAAYMLAAPLAADPLCCGTAEQLIERLVSVGLWERDDTDGFRIHDFFDFSPSRQDVLAKRAKVAERVRRYRQRTDPGFAVANVVGNSVGNGVTNVDRSAARTPAPDPDPDPISCESPRARDPYAPDRGPRPTPTHRGRWQGLLDALADASEGRFVWHEPLVSGEAAANLVRVANTIPQRETWELVGAFLAAGGEGWAGEELGIGWIQSDQFGTAVAKAKSWAQKGRPAIERRPGARASPNPRAGEFDAASVGRHNLAAETAGQRGGQRP